MRKRLNKTTEGIEAAVAKVKNNAETATKELEAKRTDGRGLYKAFSTNHRADSKVREARRFDE
jgi:hypothetical protein